MKRILLSITLLIVTSILVNEQATVVAQQVSQGAASQRETRDIDIDTEKQRSMEAIKAFAGSLQTELKQALKEGGPVNAITVCNTKANLIANDVSLERDLSIKRVSIKNRNPANSPNDWQKKVLEEFESRKHRGEPVSELTYHEVAEHGATKEFRFMKAIPTGEICITCHGPEISDDVKKRLDQLYPEDKARGFRPGDIRGAFVVTRDVSI